MAGAAGALAVAVLGGACGGAAATGGAAGGTTPDASPVGMHDPLPQGAVVRFGTTRLRLCDVVTSVAVSPDGAWVAAADRAGCIRVWSTEDGARLAHHQLEDAGGVVALAASADGRLLAAGGREGSAVVLEAGGGSAVARARIFDGPVDELRFVPDGAALVAVSHGDDRVARFGIESGHLSEQWSVGSDDLEGVHVSPDGSRLVGVSGRTVEVLDVGDGSEQATFALGGAHRPLLARFVPGGDHFAVASDEAIHILDRSGRESSRINIGFPQSVVAALEAHGERASIRDIAFLGPESLAVLPNDGTLRLVDLHGNERRRFEHGLAAARLRVSPGAHLAVLAAEGRQPWLIDLSTGRSPLVFDTHTGPVRSLAVSPDGSAVATAGEDGFVRLWSVEDGHHVAALEAGRPVDSVAFLGEGWIASGDRTGELTLWRGDGTAVQHVATADAGDREHAVRALTASPDGALLVSTNGDHVQLWRRRSDGSDPGLEEELGFDVDGCHLVALSPDGQTIAAGAEDGRLVRYRPATDRERASMGPWVEEEWAADEPLHALAWAPSGDRLVAVGPEGHIRIFADGGETVAELEGGGVPSTVAWSPDGDLIAVGRSDGAVELWSSRGEPDSPLAELRGHEGTVAGLAFSPDGGLLFSASEDETALGWDVASVGRTRQSAGP